MKFLYVTTTHPLLFQVVVVAFALTLLFKSDKDVSEFESGLGKLKDTDPDIVPLNTGT